MAQAGHTTPTPIQAQVLPVLFAGRDLVATVQAGSGTTASFALPMLQRLAAASERKTLRALILNATRERAAQVERFVRDYGRRLELQSVLAHEGIERVQQDEALEARGDVLVATPARLAELLDESSVDLGAIEVVVFNELDRMLEHGHAAVLERISAALPATRQSVVLAGTLRADAARLVAALCRDPVGIQRPRPNIAIERIRHTRIAVDRSRKRALLAHLVKSGAWPRALVFSKTKHAANRLSEQLARDGITADAVHGNRSQNARTRAIAAFKGGTLQVLVATDIAARALDLEGVQHIVGYDVPNIPEDYLYRLARVGEGGEALMFVCPEDVALLEPIESMIERAIDARVIEGFEVNAIQPARPEPQPAADAGEDAARGTARHGRTRRRRQRGGARQTSPAQPDAPAARPAAEATASDGDTAATPGAPNEERTARGRRGRGRNRNRGGDRPERPPGERTPGQAERPPRNRQPGNRQPGDRQPSDRQQSDRQPTDRQPGERRRAERGNDDDVMPVRNDNRDVRTLFSDTAGARGNRRGRGGNRGSGPAGEKRGGNRGGGGGDDDNRGNRMPRAARPPAEIDDNIGNTIAPPRQVRPSGKPPVVDDQFAPEDNTYSNQPQLTLHQSGEPKKGWSIKRAGKQVAALLGGIRRNK